MEYKLYTLVDITSTGQYRHEAGKEADRWKEQNFQTVLQTLGIRTNINFGTKPSVINTRGDIFGFNTSNIVKVWAFTFTTERDYPFGSQANPVEFLEKDFEAVPYIAGLDESMQQNYNVFVTEGPNRNIIFTEKL
jgi:hypothetical protein